jgi:excisionase family DNA binding protein
VTDPELLTVDEAAELLRTTPKAVYASLERGQLPGVVRLGRRVLFRRDDLRKHVGLLPSSQSCGPPGRR